MTALERVCTALNRASVRYAVVGGHAVALHGAVRGTVDIIIAYDLNGKQTKRIALADAVVEVLDLQALIEMKKMSGRPQDKEDVRALERLL